MEMERSLKKTHTDKESSETTNNGRKDIVVMKKPKTTEACRLFLFLFGVLLRMRLDKDREKKHIEMIYSVHSIGLGVDNQALGNRHYGTAMPILWHRHVQPERYSLTNLNSFGRMRCEAEPNPVAMNDG